MTVRFNCKTSFWYFLCIIWCNNFHDDDDDPENCSRNRSDDFITLVKAALYRIFARRNNITNQSAKRSTDVKTEKIVIEKIKPQLVSEMILTVEKTKELSGKLNESMLTNGFVSTESHWIVGDLADTDDDKLQCPANFSDDDSSSISDFTPTGIFVTNIDQECELRSLSDLDSNTSEVQENPNVAIESNDLNSIKDDEIDDNIVTEILENYENQKEILSTSFVMSSDIAMASIPDQKPMSYSTIPSEEFWDWIDPSLEEPIELIDDEMTYFVTNDDYPMMTNIETLSTTDGDQLKEKMKWLIPVKREEIEIYMTSAISHFFQVKENSNSNTFNDSLQIALKSLPLIYTNTLPVLSEMEIGDALLDVTKQNFYIDKRIIFHLVGEIFSQLYDPKICVPQMPWMHLSFMVKNKTYTLWKGRKPPESFDLVNEIVRGRVYTLLGIETHVDEEEKLSKSQTKSSHLNIIKWCIKNQKDRVDRLLAKELRAEENQWVFYDEAEERIKFKIADEIFNYLINDTMSWLGIADNKVGEL